MARLQTVLPFSDRAVQGAVPTSLVGAQYEFGLRDIAGERYNPAGPGVFVSGPFHLDGMPEILRLDADITGDVDCYLICRPQGISVTTDRVVVIAIRSRYGILVSGCLDRRRPHRRGFLPEVGVPQRRCGAHPVSPAGH
jgi:hypothetical protein